MPSEARTGCAVKRGTLARCKAAFHGRSCQFCIRETTEPSLEIDNGPGWNMIGRSVQAMYSPDTRSWLVAVFRTGRSVDGRWPIIEVRDKLAAINAALERARQVEPNARTVPWPSRHDQEWRRGGLFIMVAQPAGRRG